MEEMFGSWLGIGFETRQDFERWLGGKVWSRVGLELRLSLFGGNASDYWGVYT